MRQTFLAPYLAPEKDPLAATRALPELAGGAMRGQSEGPVNPAGPRGHTLPGRLSSRDVWSSTQNLDPSRFLRYT